MYEKSASMITFSYSHLSTSQRLVKLKIKFDNSTSQHQIRFSLIFDLVKTLQTSWKFHVDRRLFLNNDNPVPHIQSITVIQDSA